MNDSHREKCVSGDYGRLVSSIRPLDFFGDPKSDLRVEGALMGRCQSHTLLFPSHSAPSGRRAHFRCREGW